MCVIAVKPQGVDMFSERYLENMFANNPDGAGYALWRPGENLVEIRKGLMHEEALLSSIEAKEPRKEDVLVVHCRISTGGFTTGRQTHPFAIEGGGLKSSRTKTKLAVAHNGIIPWIDPVGGASDTVLFSRYVLKPHGLRIMSDQSLQKHIESMMGSSRLVFLDYRGRFLTLGTWIEDDGVLYSNDSYKRDSRIVGFRGKGTKYTEWWDYDPKEDYGVDVATAVVPSRQGAGEETSRENSWDTDDVIQTEYLWEDVDDPLIRAILEDLQEDADLESLGPEELDALVRERIEALQWRETLATSSYYEGAP